MAGKKQQKKSVRVGRRVRPSAQKTVQSKSPAASVTNEYLKMLANPRDAPAVGIPDTFSSKTACMKTVATTDLALNAAGQAFCLIYPGAIALKVGTITANVLASLTNVGTPAWIATAQSGFISARLTSMYIEVISTASSTADGGRIMCLHGDSASSWDSKDVTTLGAYASMVVPLKGGMEMRNLPYISPDFILAATSSTFNSNESTRVVGICVTGGAANATGALTIRVTYNWEGVPIADGGLAGTARVTLPNTNMIDAGAVVASANVNEGHPIADHEVRHSRWDQLAGYAEQAYTFTQRHPGVTAAALEAMTAMF